MYNFFLKKILAYKYFSMVIEKYERKIKVLMRNKKKPHSFTNVIYHKYYALKYLRFL